MARRCLFDAYLEDSVHGEATPLSQFCATLLGPKRTNSGLVTESEEARFFQRAKKLPDWQYEKLLTYIHLQGPPWPRAHNDPRVTFDAFILPPSGVQLTNLTNTHHQTFSTFSSHQGNSCVQFYENRAHTSKNSGFIRTIWQMPLQSQLRTFFFIELHKPLPMEEQQKAPYDKYPFMMTGIFDAARSGSWAVVEEKDIIAHAVAYPRPAGAYGIPKKTLVICWSLNRGRR
ncbi:hypothetical protein MPER_13151 [Moniliophthora perniciosa FA553]|nr:hypothetical protein MPER_13151 [Moniliophthora perniciosa FA553]